MSETDNATPRYYVDSRWVKDRGRSIADCRSPEIADKVAAALNAHNPAHVSLPRELVERAVEAMEEIVYGSCGPNGMEALANKTLNALREALK